MRVLIVRTSPDVVGGAELSAYDQAIVLNELGHEGIHATNNKYIRSRAKNDKVTTTWFPWINRGPRVLRYFIFFSLIPFTYLWAIILVWRHKPDIINTQSREDHIAFTNTRWLHKTPVVWKDPGDLRFQLVPEYDNAVKRFYRRSQLHAIRNADHIALLNSDDEEYLFAAMGEKLKNTSCVPSSILYRYYDRSAAPIEDKGKKTIVGTLARLEPNKGLQYLVETAKDIDDKNVEFWIVNDGSYKPELVQMASGYENIRFFPYTTNMSGYLNTFDIFVHPVEAEGWGRVIKEAMYFGLPVIGSDVGGVKRQIEDGKTGYLVPIGDKRKLKKRLLELLEDDKLRSSIGKSAKTKAEADGDFTEIVKQQILPIYERFVKK